MPSSKTFPPQSRAKWIERTRRALADLPREVDYARLSRAGQVDFEIFKHELEKTLWLNENTRPFEEDPRTYTDYINGSVYVLLTQSTLPKETNLANAIARMRQIPRLVAAARQTIDPSAAIGPGDGHRAEPGLDRLL